MISTVQPELPLSAARLELPTVKRDGARSLLGVDDWQLDAAIDGSLSGVINVASKGARRRDLRFMVVCLVEHLRQVARERTPEEIAVLIFGQRQALIRARWFYARLQFKHSHFYDLVNERVIHSAKDSQQRTGPGGGLVIEWSEAVRFIKERRIT